MRAVNRVLRLPFLVVLAVAWSVPSLAQQPRTVTPRPPLPGAERAVIDLFQHAAPSVSYIFTISAREDLLGRKQISGGAGSGFVWDRTGHIVTNYHVVEGADRVAVALDAGEPLAARVVGVAPNYDLAVLQINQRRNDLTPIPLGTSADLQVGQWVFAIGNPYGLSRTMTTGIISALDRHLPTDTGREIANVIQTDASINPGNSGGPLLDSAGRLIGMTTAIVSGSGASAGIGFAIPADTINRVVPQLIANGRVPTAGIGVLVLPEEIATRLGVKGVPIADTVPNSPAAEAGITGMDRTRGRLGDVVTRVNNKPVANLAEMANALEDTGIGKRAELTVLRDGKIRKVSVRVIDISQNQPPR